MLLAGGLAQVVGQMGGAEHQRIQRYIRLGVTRLQNLRRELQSPFRRELRLVRLHDFVHDGLGHDQFVLHHAQHGEHRGKLETFLVFLHYLVVILAVVCA